VGGVLFLLEAINFQSLTISLFLAAIRFLVVLTGFIFYKEIYGLAFFDDSFKLTIPMTLGSSCLISITFFNSWRLSREQHSAVLEVQDYRGRMASILGLAIQQVTFSTVLSIVVTWIVAVSFGSMVYITSAVSVTTMLVINAILMVLAFPSFLVLFEQLIEDRAVRQQMRKNPEQYGQLSTPIFRRGGIHRVCEDFFHSKMVHLAKFKWPLVLVSAVYTAFLITWAYEKKVHLYLPDQPATFRETNEYFDIANKYRQFFDEIQADGVTDYPLVFYWGVKDSTGSRLEHFDITDFGEVIMEDLFDPSSYAAQKSLLSFCSQLDQASFVKSKRTFCWYSTFLAHYKNENKLTGDVAVPEGSFNQAVYKWAT
jgi:hypothetical protein